MRISSHHIAAIFRHATAVTDEVCGVLIGQRTPHILVNQVVKGRNLHPQPHRHFLLDAASLLQADTIARSNGQTIIGFYHSHPNGTAFPSSYDRRDGWPEAIMLIVAAGNVGPTYCCVWTALNHRLVPEPIQIIRHH